MSLITQKVASTKEAKSEKRLQQEIKQGITEGGGLYIHHAAEVIQLRMRPVTMVGQFLLPGHQLMTLELNIVA